MFNSVFYLPSLCNYLLHLLAVSVGHKIMYNHALVGNLNFIQSTERY